MDPSLTSSFIIAQSVSEKRREMEAERESQYLKRKRWGMAIWLSSSRWAISEEGSPQCETANHTCTRWKLIFTVVNISANTWLYWGHTCLWTPLLLNESSEWLRSWVSHAWTPGYKVHAPRPCVTMQDYFLYRYLLQGELYYHLVRSKAC